MGLDRFPGERLGLGSAAMDSPENSKAKPASAASPAVQDSPFLLYVSSLSPLPTVNVRPGVIAYGDLSFPSPEPVFKSPHFNHPRKLRRSQNLPLTDAGKSSPNYANDAPAFSESMQTTGPSVSQSTFQLIPVPGKQFDGDYQSHVQQCSSPSSCVHVFLADSSESSDNPSDPPDHSLKQVAETSKLEESCIGTKKNEKKWKEDGAQPQPVTSLVLAEDFTNLVECSASSDIADPKSMQATIPLQALRNGPTSVEETNANISGNKECMITKANESLTSSCQSKENAGREQSFCLNLAENEGRLKMVGRADEVSERLVDELPAHLSNNDNNDVNLCSAPATGTQHGLSSEVWDASNDPSFGLKGSDIVGHRKATTSTSVVCCRATQDVELDPAETGEWCELDSTCHLLVESLQDTQIDNFIYKPGSNSIASSENQIPYDQEEGAQYQRGMRKRLQFDTIENCRMSIGGNKSFRNLKKGVCKEGPLVSSLEVDPLTSSDGEFVATSSNELMIQSVSGNALCKLPLKVDKFGQVNGSSPQTAPRPSGIGLHLNSLGSGQINTNINTHSLGEDLGAQGQVLHFGCNDVTLHDSENHLSSTSVMGQTKNQLLYPVAENNPVIGQENQSGNQSKSSVSYQPNKDGKPFSSSMESKLDDRYVTPCNTKRLSSEDATLSLETGQSSPRKKRKKAPDDEGQKHCNCKRSKCLKLYCDCFAAGIFCTEACACHECFNRLEHEDTVHETRKQIESRNPLAFAPKVVVRVSDPTKDNEASKRLTPTSARHKRGCNCKKSLCLKKYCECFQAGVGCSLGCRCEGCKNTFGRKDGCEIIEVEHKKSKVEGGETDSSGGKLDRAHVKRVVINTTQCSSRLSPLTPSVQVSSGIDVPKSQLPSSYCTSPESSTSPLPYFEESPSSPVDALSNNTLAVVPYNEYSKSHSAIKVETCLPGWDGFSDICNSSPLANPSLSTSGASAAPKIRENEVLQTKLYQGGTRLSVSSLRWRSSPVTPLPQFGERKIVLEPDSDSGLHNYLEDDTPEVLKDTRSPIKMVKANSPKQKRVSPPQRQLHGTRSTSSPGLRSGRKFILKSVPSFPPLTPYSNSSKGNGT